MRNQEHWQGRDLATDLADVARDRGPNKTPMSNRRGYRRSAHVACCVFGTLMTVFSLATPEVRADPPKGTPTIALEAHVGARSSEASAVVGRVLDELERRGLVARPGTVGTLIGGRAPRPGVLDGEKSAATIAQLIDSGLESFTTGNFKEARVTLALAVRLIERNPALVVDMAGAMPRFDALVGLALSQARLGQAAESTATMMELIRIFRGQPIRRAQHGPEAEQLYRRVLEADRRHGPRAPDDHRRR